MRESDFEVLDPWDAGIEPPPGQKDRHGTVSTCSSESVTVKMIESSGGMLTVLDGTHVDSGTASEIGCAFALGKKTLCYRGDFRFTGDNPGSTVNLQVEYFIRKSGGRAVRSIEELADALGDVFSD